MEWLDSAWIKRGLQSSGELLLTAAWSFHSDTENINQKTAQVILHLMLKTFHIELHKKFHPLSNWEIPARSRDGKDGALGMLEAGKDSVSVKLLAIMSDRWLHMFLLNVFRFTGEIGLKYLLNSGRYD